MPIFEYVCQKCHHRFECIVLNGEKPKCPECASRKLERQVEQFAEGRAARPPRGINSDSVVAHARALLGNIPTVPRYKATDLGSPGRRSRRSTVA
jgi:putative FmdB family regulatory protein